MQRRPCPVKADFILGRRAQYLSDLISIAGLNCPAKFFGVNHNFGTPHAAAQWSSRRMVRKLRAQIVCGEQWVYSPHIVRRICLRHAVNLVYKHRKTCGE
jgi:hypothetical protein